jgi:hypothetical protein
MAVVVAMYLRVMPPMIGLATTGKAGLRYGSLFDTYALVLHNSELKALLGRYLGQTSIHQTQMGGSIVAMSIKGLGNPRSSGTRAFTTTGPVKYRV